MKLESLAGVGLLNRLFASQLKISGEKIVNYFNGFSWLILDLD